MLQDRHRAMIQSLDRLLERDVAPVAACIDREDAFPEEAMADAFAL